MRIPLIADAVKVGEPIPWALYCDNRLILKKGTTISSRRQLDSLLMRDAYYLNDEPESTSVETKVVEKTPFDHLHNILIQLPDLYIAISAGETDGVDQETQMIAQNLISHYESYPDALRGAVHLFHEYDYTLVHPIHTAILCLMLMDGLSMSASNRISVVCAALTMNVSMNNIQLQLQEQRRPDEMQQTQILNHPIISADLLRACGVHDQDWLAFVEQHHECYDGSGYPNQLKGDAILLGAQIVLISDRYSAMISKRSYREGLKAQASMKELFSKKGEEIDEVLTKKFINDIGVYPAGSFVRLENGECGIVIENGDQPIYPIVSVYISSRGTAYDRPIRRDTKHDPFGIDETISPDQSIHFNLNKIWLF